MATIPSPAAHRARAHPEVYVGLENTNVDARRFIDTALHRLAFCEKKVGCCYHFALFCGCMDNAKQGMALDGRSAGELAAL